MKLIALTWWCAAGVAAGADMRAHSFINFAGGTPGQLFSTACLPASTFSAPVYHHGYPYLPAWEYYAADAGLDFRSWTVVTGPSMRFPARLIVGTNSFVETGTHWLRVYHTNSNPYEAVSFKFSAGHVGKVLVTAFYRFAATNASQVNYDHLVCYGGPFSSLQEQILPHGSSCLAHAQSDQGLTVNGQWVTMEVGKVVWLSYFRDDRAGLFRVRFYDPADFSLIAQSQTTQMGTEGEPWWLLIQANYLELGGSTGYTELTGLTVEYGDEVTDDIVMDTPFKGSKVTGAVHASGHCRVN